MVETCKPSLAGLHQVAQDQDGLFTAKQALRAGYSAQLLAHYTRAGKIVRVHRGIYRLSSFPPGEQETLITVWLWSETAGVFTHLTALLLHGLSDRAQSDIHLTLPSDWQDRRFRLPEHVVLHHADVPTEDRTWIGAVPATSPRRTLNDCAQAGIARELLQPAALRALQRRLVTREEIDVGFALDAFSAAHSAVAPAEAARKYGGTEMRNLTAQDVGNWGPRRWEQAWHSMPKADFDRLVSLSKGKLPAGSARAQELNDKLEALRARVIEAEAERDRAGSETDTVRRQAEHESAALGKRCMRAEAERDHARAERDNLQAQVRVLMAEGTRARLELENASKAAADLAQRVSELEQQNESYLSAIAKAVDAELTCAPNVEVVNDAPLSYLKFTSGVLRPEDGDAFGANVIGLARRTHESNTTVERQREAKRAAEANARALLAADMPKKLRDALDDFLRGRDEKDD